MKKNTSSSEFIDIRIENGILIGVFVPDLDLDLEIAKQVVAERLKIQNGKSYPLLIHSSFKNTTKEARHYMKNEGLEGVKAGAFIVYNEYSLSIINFFIMMLNNKVPSRVFKTEEKALRWLERYKDE